MDGDVGEAVTFGLLIGSVVGALCGLVPLIFGVVRSQIPLAIGGFFACVVCGAILGLILAIPIAALFAYLIVRASRKPPVAPGTPYGGQWSPPDAYGGTQPPPPPGTPAPAADLRHRLRPAASAAPGGPRT
ncbi:MAG: hypothetical protein WKF31_02060 [Thermoleophilaceae bacterium]